MTPKPQYRSLDLLKGIAKGWQANLSGREKQVLLYVAQYGRQNEPGYAFVWHPMKGMDWWAEDMAMTRTTFYKTLKSLKKKGLLTTTEATKKWGTSGYGITISVMATSTTCGTHNPTCGTRTVPHVVLGSPTCGISPPLLTCDDGVHNQSTNQSTNQLLTQSHPAGAIPERTNMDFDTPRDEPNDFDVPKEAKTKLKRKDADKSPQSRLMWEFHEQWSIARCRNTSFGVAYNNQGTILNVFKRLLDEYSEAHLHAMIKVFFDQAAAGRMKLGGNEMYRDFLNNRAEVWRIVHHSGTVPVLMETQSHQRALEIGTKMRASADRRAAKEAAREAKKATKENQ